MKKRPVPLPAGKQALGIKGINNPVFNLLM
jgi:hypothetical protein